MKPLLVEFDELVELDELLDPDEVEEVEEEPTVGAVPDDSVSARPIDPQSAPGGNSSPAQTGSGKAL